MTDKDTSVIPKGMYCYGSAAYTEDDDGNFHLEVKDVCPYWSIREDKPKQENGYCALFEEGDWEHDGIGLVWDMVKECDYNDGLEDIDEWYDETF